MNHAAFFFATQNPFVSYVRQVFRPDPFQGLYQLNTFDVLLLIPYFIVLIILATYGFHRYFLVYSYFRNRRNRPAPPSGHLNPLPRVTVQLPFYNEQYVAERLIEEACRMEYPKELLEIQVLDDSTDETIAIARNCVERMVALGHPVKYIHRNNREGYKAGALAEGLRQAHGEFIAIFDADFLPPPDFLTRTLPYFHHPHTGMVQTRWNYINRNYSLLTRIQAILLDGHFILEHGARSRSGCFFNFNGTAGIWRRKAIEDAGGWQHDTLTEDTDLSYRAQLQGWKFLYLPEIECMSELPVDMNAFKVQQARWAKGLIQTSRKILPTIWRSRLPLHIKLEAFFHLTANFSYPLMIALTGLLLPAMIVRFYQGWFQMLYIDVPMLLSASFSISSFYLVAQRELFPKDWKKTFFYLPLLMATGIGLTITNAWAVAGALAGKQSEFVRTPKYRIESGRDRFFSKAYRNRAHWVALVEILLGVYFAYTVFYAVQNANYATVPFLCIFVLGYLGTGLISLLQEHWGRALDFVNVRGTMLLRLLTRRRVQES